MRKLLLAALSCLLAFPAAAQAIPGDDFFAYANRAWLDATTLPAGSPRWGARDELEA